MKYTAVYMLVVCLLCPLVVPAQDFSAQMKNFLSQIGQAESISYVSNIDIDYVDGTKLKQKIIYQRSLDVVYYKTDKVELMGDKTLSLMIYPENKVVVWQKTESDKNTLENEKFIISDSLFNKCDSIVYLGQTDGFYKYIVYTNNKYIQKTALSFRVADGLLTHADYYYNQTQNQTVLKSSVDFVSFSIDKTQTISKRWSSVLIYMNKNYTLASGYSGYKLISLNSK